MQDLVLMWRTVSMHWQDGLLRLAIGRYVISCLIASFVSVLSVLIETWCLVPIIIFLVVFVCFSVSNKNNILETIFVSSATAENYVVAKYNF